jgi:hypothetical protein
MNSKLKGVLTSVGVVGLVIGGPVVLAAVTSNNAPPPEPEIICTFEAIPYEQTEEETEDLDLGDTRVEVVGTNGEREICTKDDVEISNEVIVEPVDELTLVGTYEEPEYEDYNSAGCPKNQYVNGYYKANGTYVAGYWRNSPTDNCY